MKMPKLEIELTQATAEDAREAGLLDPAVVERLFSDAIKRKRASATLLSMVDRVAAAGIAPVPMDEIDAEVKAVRAARRADRR
jgi:hypothetical protein